MPTVRTDTHCVYKPGKAGDIRVSQGFYVKAKVVREEDLDAALEAGWVQNHEDTREKPVERQFSDAEKQKIVKAVDGLDVSNDAHWTDTGRPELDDIKAATGIELTREELDDALPDGDVRGAKIRADLEAKATELGVSFDGRTSDAKLAARIAEKEAE